MTALEAVGEEIAPSAPASLPIPEREAVWPELSAWRAPEEAEQQLRARADRIAGEEERYRPHLDALPAVRDGIARASGQIDYFMLQHDPAGPTKGQGP